MKMYYLFLFLLLSVSINAQCKYKKNHIDEFEKKEIKITKQKIIYLNYLTNAGLTYSFEKVGNVRFVRLRWTTHSLRSIYKDKDNLQVILDNGQVYELLSCTYETSSVAGEMWYISPVYHISTHLYEELKKHKIVKYRIHTQQGYTEKELPEKKAKIFQKTLKCIE